MSNFLSWSLYRKPFLTYLWGNCGIVYIICNSYCDYINLTLTILDFWRVFMGEKIALINVIYLSLLRFLLMAGQKTKKNKIENQNDFWLVWRDTGWSILIPLAYASASRLLNTGKQSSNDSLVYPSHSQPASRTKTSVS